MDKYQLCSALKKLAYVVIREDLASPIIKSQVIDVLEEIAKNGGRQVTLLWFYRVDYVFRGGVKIRILRNNLLKKGIRLIAIPFLSWRFPVSWWGMLFVLPQWVFGLTWAYVALGIRVFHCRSYHAALAAACFCKITRTRFLFDPRSPFLEENLAAKHWSPCSSNYLFWSKIEMWLCRSAFKVLSVSQPFADRLSTKGARGKVVVVPNNYPKAFVVNKGNISVESGRLDDRELRICYVGSLGHWNDSELYLNFIEQFVRTSKLPVSVLFVVPKQSAKILHEALAKRPIPPEVVKVKTLPQEKVRDEIETCTVGIYLMRHVDGRLGVKCVEYLAAGVPVIVSENIRGAANCVRSNGVGFVIDDDWANFDAAMRFAETVMRDRAAWREKCRELAVTEFSPLAVASKLASLYVDACLEC